MDTRKLPPALLVALGLAGCGDDGTEASTSACLSFTSETETATSSSGSGSETDTEGTGTTFGPCLDVAPPTGTTSGTTGTDTDTDSTGDSTTFGPCLEPPLPTSTGESDSSGTTTALDDAPDRDEVLRTLTDRGILPPDIATKLRDPDRSPRS